MRQKEKQEQGKARQPDPAKIMLQPKSGDDITTAISENQMSQLAPLSHWPGCRVLCWAQLPEYHLHYACIVCISFCYENTYTHTHTYIYIHTIYIYVVYTCT